MINNVLEQMLTDIQSRGKRSRSEILTEAVEARLQKSLEVYYKQLKQSYNALQGIDETKVLTTLTNNKKGRNS